jgi:hypothetical protein
MDTSVYGQGYREKGLSERDSSADKIKLPPHFTAGAAFFVEVTCKPEKTKKPFNY